MRILGLATMAMLFAGCFETDEPKNTDTTSTLTEPLSVCDRATLSCAECYDGDVTCSYDDYSATAASCGGCQAEVALFAELCDAGVTTDANTISAEMVCEDVAGDTSTGGDDTGINPTGDTGVTSTGGTGLTPTGDTSITPTGDTAVAPPTGDTSITNPDLDAICDFGTLGCPECYDGQVTCTFGAYSETAASCGTCQAEVALFASLCAAEVSDSLATIQADMVCL